MTHDLRTRLQHLIGTYEATLLEKGYTPGTIKTYRVLLRHLATRVEAAGIEPANLTAERAAELVHDTERWRREPNKCQNMARRFVAHLIEPLLVSRRPFGLGQAAKAWTSACA